MMVARAIDDRLVTALCRAAEREPGDAETAVRGHLRRLAPLAGPDDADRLVRAAVARLDGLGSLDALLADPTVDEVLVNAAGDIWVERYGEVERHGDIPPTDLAIVVERILAPLGRRLDRTTPIVDARLADGTRVCAVVPPISLGGTCLSLRRFRATPLPLDAFAIAPVAAVLAELVARRCNVVVSGATSSGKTSLLSSLLTLIAPGERVVVLEDTAELAPAIDHVVRLEARPATSDGVAAITLDRLLADRVAAATRPPRGRRGSRGRGARTRPGAQHGARRVAVDLPREQRAGRGAPAGDAGGAGCADVAVAGRAQPPAPVHRRDRARRARRRRTAAGRRDRRARRGRAIGTSGDVPPMRTIVRGGAVVDALGRSRTSDPR